MKNKLINKNIIIIFLILFTLFSCSGCALKKQIMTKQGKQECYLDDTDATKFTYNGQQYTILNDIIESSELGDWVGFIQKYAALDNNYKILNMQDMGTNITGDLKKLAEQSNQAAYYIPYLNVYRLKNNTGSTTLIIDVDNAFHRAVLSESIKEGDFKIIFSSEINTNNENLTDDVPTINRNDLRKLLWNGNTYKITEQEVPDELLGDYLCTISENVTFDAETGKELTKDELNNVEVMPKDISNKIRENRIYGSVYTLKDGYDSSLAIEVNYKYVYARIEK